MKITKCVKLIFDKPNMRESTVETIVYGCTGFPSFWHTDYPIKEFIYSLRHAKRSLKRGFTIDQIFEGKDFLNKKEDNGKRD